VTESNHISYKNLLRLIAFPGMPIYDESDPNVFRRVDTYTISGEELSALQAILRSVEKTKVCAWEPLEATPNKDLDEQVMSSD